MFLSQMITSVSPNFSDPHFLIPGNNKCGTTIWLYSYPVLSSGTQLIDTAYHLFPTDCKTTCTIIASLTQLFWVPTRKSCCYSKTGSGQFSSRVAKDSWQLFQVWRSYSECLLGKAVAVLGQAWINALLGLLHNLAHVSRVLADHWFQHFIAKFHQYFQGKDWFYVLNSILLMILKLLIV